MNFKYPFIFLLNITIAHAQQIHLQGSVADAKTNQPIAAATISIQSKNFFYPADNEGKFNITTNKLTGTDSVGFSCIGYQTKKIKVGDIPSNIVIKLSPMVNMLQEVKVGINAPALIKVGSKEKGGGEWSAYLTGLDLAAFMEGSQHAKGVIQTVGFYLNSGRGDKLKGGDVTVPFRVKLFEVDTNGIPGKEITKDIIIVSAKKVGAWFDVDISAYQIQNPDSGFFAAFSLLTNEYYKLKKGAATADEPLAHNGLGASNLADFNIPRLGITLREYKTPRSYFSVENSASNKNWHWEKTYSNHSYLIRASIATE
jgi:hypothetical protein